MNNFWNNWIEAVRFTCEAQNVISARLMLLAAGSPDAVVEETARMVSEKVLAFAKAGIAAEQALENGFDIYTAAERAYAPMQRAVHANSERLIGALH